MWDFVDAYVRATGVRAEAQAIRATPGLNVRRLLLDSDGPAVEGYVAGWRRAPTGTGPAHPLVRRFEDRRTRARGLRIRLPLRLPEHGHPAAGPSSPGPATS